ncbi:unnamed protein product, partial [Polarella glacialis]
CRSALVGRLAALVAPTQEDDVEPSPTVKRQKLQPSEGSPASSEEVPCSLEGLSIEALQAACLACNLSAEGNEAALTSRLAVHMTQATQVEADVDEEEEEEELPAVAWAPPQVRGHINNNDNNNDNNSSSSSNNNNSNNNDNNNSRSSTNNNNDNHSHLSNNNNNHSYTNNNNTNLSSASQPDTSLPCSIPAAQPDDQGVAFAPPTEEQVEPPKDVGAAWPSPQTKAREDGAREGLKLLHTEELRQACAERGLETSGRKRELVSRLLDYAAHAPLPTPTQDDGSFAATSFVAQMQLRRP